MPVIVDPSHATGRVDLIAPMSLGAILAGSDGEQQLNLEQFRELMTKVNKTIKFRKELDSTGK